MARTLDTTLGELISRFYEAFLAELGDPDLARLATAAAIQDLLSRPPRRQSPRARAA